jgi:hypothetical protein
MPTVHSVACSFGCSAQVSHGSLDLHDQHMHICTSPRVDQYRSSKLVLVQCLGTAAAAEGIVSADYHLAHMRIDLGFSVSAPGSV